MAVGDVTSPRPGLVGLLDALFREAWDLQRRRRRRWLLVLVLAGVLVAGLVLALGGGGAGHGRGASRRPAVVGRAVRYVVRGAQLPAAGSYSSLMAVGGRLIVWGDSQGASLSTPSVSAFSLSRLGLGTCTVATVDPANLEIGRPHSGSCADPRLYGEGVVPVLDLTRAGPAGLTDRIRVSHVVGRGFKVGPVIATYRHCSDCDAVWTYGGGALWIDVPGARRSRLLRVSARTGQVVQRLRFPAMYQPLISADADGLWVAPSLFSGGARGGGSLWRVTPGGVGGGGSIRRVTPRGALARRVLALNGNGALWIVAAGQTLWVDAAGRGGAGAASTLWRLRDADTRVLQRVRGVKHANRCLAGPEDATAIGANASAGIFCFGPGGKGDVFHIAPGSGVAGRVARVKVPRTFYSPPAAMLGNAFFFLVPRTRGSGRLYRLSAS